MGERERRAEIARLNDQFRSTGQGGEVFMTQGIGALPILERLHILAAVRGIDAFTPDNDPHGEHDCAVLKVRGHRVIWKIDYLPRQEEQDPDPTDPQRVRRVMTIMLAEEY